MWYTPLKFLRDRLGIVIEGIKEEARRVCTLSPFALQFGLPTGFNGPIAVRQSVAISGCSCAAKRYVLA
jgi:hypothetical protein